MKKIIGVLFLALGILISAHAIIINDSTMATLGIFSTQKAGLLDATWGTAGNKTYNPGGTTNTCGYVLCADDGSVFVSGKKDSTGFIVKFDNSGNLKTEFGTSGQLTNSTVTNGFISLALDESTHTLYALGTNTTHSYVVAYNAITGTVITTFSTTLSGQAQATGMAIDATGLYVLVGTGTAGNLYKVNLATGSLDSQFNNGAVISLGSDFYTPLGIKIRGDYVYVVGTISGSPYTSTVHKRNKLTGSLVWSGTCPENVYPGNHAYGYNALGIDSNDRVYVPVDDGSNTGIYRFSALDGTSTNTITVGSSGLTSLIISCVYIDEMDNILLVGTQTGGFGPAQITRLFTGGSTIDSSFGSSGTVTNENMNRTNQFAHADFDIQGRIMLAGSASSNNIIIARYTGALYQNNTALHKLQYHHRLGHNSGLIGKT